MRKKSNNGYKDNSSNKYKDSLIINSNNITMDGVSQKLMAVELDKEGKIIGTKFMKPNNGEYNFPKAQTIMEIPQYKKGGKQKLYTQDDLDMYLAMYMNGGMHKYETGGEPPINETNYLPSYLYGQQQQKTENTGLGPVGIQNQATPTQKQQVQIPQARQNITPMKGIQAGFAPMGDDIQKQIEVANEKPSQEIEESINPEQRQGIELTNNPNIQFFNQYQGVDIPTAAYTLGTSIESGDTLGTVASSLKLATGLGRNIMGGLGQQKQYKRQQQDYYEKVGEQDPATSFERGGQYQDDLSMYMNMVDPTDPKDKKLTPEQIKALNEASGVEFTEEGANSLFQQMPAPLPPPMVPKLNLGKYKDVNYFDSTYNRLTGEYDVTPTKNNPANADLYKENLRYLQEMNPNLKINRRGHDSGYTPLSQREEFEKGGQYQDDLVNYMTMIDPKDKKLTPEQIKELNEKSGVEFTEEGANSIFEQMPDPLPPPVAPKLNLGKYKDVGYFDSRYNYLTKEYDVTPTKNNPANADLYKENLRYLQEMNPNLKINRRGHNSGYTPLSQREEFEKGGQYQGDEYRTGFDEDMLTNQQKQLLNAETEAGEYIKDPDTQKVSEIVGDKHSQGGEKMVMKQEEKVLTDHTKLGAKNAKYIKETYDIDIKAKNTYSDVLDKIRSKTGLKKLVQEEEGYIEKLEKLSDKDKVTGSINTKFLEEKLEEVRAKKEPLEKVRQTIFDDLYRIQEEEKQVSEYQEQFQKGGEKISKEEAKKGVESGELEDLDRGQYIKRGREQSLDSYRQTWDRNKFPNFEDYVNAAEQWKADNPGWNSSEKDKRYYTEETPLRFNPQGLVLNKSGMIEANINPFLPRQNNEITQEGVEQDDDTQIEKKRLQKTKTPRNIALLPNQYPMSPNSLEPTIKENTSYAMFNPSLMDPTIDLENLQRQKLQAERGMEGLPPQVRQAALANLDANMARANADTMLKIDAQNINSKNRAEEMNTRIANRQVDANNRDRLMFEGRALTAKSNTDRDYQNYFNKGMEVNLQNYKDINALNRSNATHGVQYDGQNYIKPNAPDFSKYYEMTQQLAKYQQKEKDAEKKKKTKK